MANELTKFIDDSLDFDAEVKAILKENPTSYVIKVNKPQGKAFFGLTTIDKFDWKELLQDTIDYLKEASPVLTGTYRKSFWFNIDGRNYKDIPNIDKPKEVFIYNIQPYTRKIEISTFSAKAPSGTFYEAYYDIQRDYEKEIKDKIFTIEWDTFKTIRSAPLASDLPRARYPGLRITFL